MSKAYILNHDYEHSGDPGRDAFHLPFKNSESISLQLMRTNSDDLPEKICFQANFDLIPKYDYPLSDLEIPVMSARMLKVLQDVKSFEYKIIPIIMIDDAVSSDDYDWENEEFNDVAIDRSYVALQLLNRAPVVDLEKSEFMKLSSQPDKPGILVETVLKCPKDGFPSVFRIDGNPSELFVSSEAKDALLAAGIKGCVFEEVEVTT